MSQVPTEVEDRRGEPNVAEGGLPAVDVTQRIEQGVPEAVVVERGATQVEVRAGAQVVQIGAAVGGDQVGETGCVTGDVYAPRPPTPDPAHWKRDRSAITAAPPRTGRDVNAT